jgi:hypothetical protein
MMDRERTLRSLAHRAEVLTPSTRLAIRLLAAKSNLDGLSEGPIPKILRGGLEDAKAVFLDALSLDGRPDEKLAAMKLLKGYVLSLGYEDEGKNKIAREILLAAYTTGNPNAIMAASECVDECMKAFTKATRELFTGGFGLEKSDDVAIALGLDTLRRLSEE